MQAEILLTTHLRQLEERLLQPDVRRSAQDVADLLADEFIEFGSSGRVFDKQQMIAALKHEPTLQRTVMEFNTPTLAPGVVWATYRIVRHGASGEPPMHSLRSSIWTCIEGRWHMMFHQGTLAQEPHRS
jgi:hypothetical protein